MKRFEDGPFKPAEDEPIELLSTCVGVRYMNMLCGRARQFPVVLAYAIPALSPQGFTMSPGATLVLARDQVKCISLPNYLYVMLSRVKGFRDIRWETCSCEDPPTVGALRTLGVVDHQTVAFLHKHFTN